MMMAIDAFEHLYRHAEEARDRPEIAARLHRPGRRSVPQDVWGDLAVELGLIEARAYHQKACFEAGVQFARCEGIVPAPEATHAVRAAIDEALRCKQMGKSETILFNLSGHGHFDMAAYINYFEGKLVDQKYDEGELAMALAGLPSVAA